MSDTDIVVLFIILPIIFFAFYVIVIDPQLVIFRIMSIKYSLFFKLPMFKKLGCTYYDEPYKCPHCGKEIEELKGK
jgi:hypothetical protein